MKNVLFVLGILLILSIVAVYAHGNSNENDDHYMELEEMNAMHELMAKSLDPELKEEMDKMHEGCMGSLNEEEKASIVKIMGVG